MSALSDARFNGHAGSQAEAVKLERHVRDLDLLSFTNPKELLDWLVRLEELGAEISGVGEDTRPVDFRTLYDSRPVLAKFAAHGFVPNMNCGPNYDGGSVANVQGWLIGQALSFVACNGVPQRLQLTLDELVARHSL